MGSAFNAIVNEKMASTKSGIVEDIPAAVAQLNLSDHVFLGKIMVITGFTLGNLSNKEKLAEEIAYLFDMSGIVDKIGDMKRENAHTDGEKVDIMIRLKKYHLFGAMRHVNVENRIYVIPAIQIHQGSVFKRTYLLHVLEVALAVIVQPPKFHELLCARGIPQPSLTHTAAGVMLFWGLQAVVSVLRI